MKELAGSRRVAVMSLVLAATLLPPVTRILNAGRPERFRGAPCYDHPFGIERNSQHWVRCLVLRSLSL